MNITKAKIKLKIKKMVNKLKKPFTEYVELPPSHYGFPIHQGEQLHLDAAVTVHDNGSISFYNKKETLYLCTSKRINNA